MCQCYMCPAEITQLCLAEIKQGYHVTYASAHGLPIEGYNLCTCDMNHKVITFDDHPNGVRVSDVIPSSESS